MNSVLIGLFTFLIGLLLGNRMSIDRDKRKEFNEVAQPIRAWILNEISKPSPDGHQPKVIEIDKFISYLPFWKRRGFRKAYEGQNRARDEALDKDSMGSVFYKDDSSIKKYLNALLPYTDRL